MSTEKTDSATASMWLERGLFLALFLACAVALSPNLADADLWGHVQYGLDALADGLPATTTYSFTAEQYTWINHENLAEVVLALVATASGGPGLLAMKCLLGLGVIALVIRQSKSQGAGLLAISVVALLVSVNVTYHWSVRPQVFSYTMFALLMAFVTWCFERVSARLKYLWLVPILFVIWTNTHGGFLAGYCIFSFLLACRAIEVLATDGRRGVSWTNSWAPESACSPERACL